MFLFISKTIGLGGGTYFPDLPGVSDQAAGDKFSRTTQAGSKGLVVKPRRGNGIFWIGVHMNGTGDDRMSHAALPVTSGIKIGMNMFGLYFYDLPLIGDVA